LGVVPDSRTASSAARLTVEAEERRRQRHRRHQGVQRRHFRQSKRVIVQVKSGGVNSGMIRDLVGTIQREEAAIGVFLTLEAATKPMIDEAAARILPLRRLAPRLPANAILTVEEVLAGKQIEMPPSTGPFKQAEKISSDSTDQNILGFE